MESINDFVKKFNTNVNLDNKCIVKKQTRLYFLNESLKRLSTKNFFHAGTYLGKIKTKTFFPSLVMLSMMAKRKANKVTVDERTEWLFICGRDIFKRGILKSEGSKRKGDYTLVVNQYCECLGFGEMICDMNEDERDADTLVVKNFLDIGDFLRRER